MSKSRLKRQRPKSREKHSASNGNIKGLEQTVADVDVLICAVTWIDLLKKCCSTFFSFSFFYSCQLELLLLPVSCVLLIM